MELDEGFCGQKDLGWNPKHFLAEWSWTKYLFLQASVSTFVKQGQKVLVPHVVVLRFN